MSKEPTNPDPVTYPLELGFDFSNKPIPVPSWMPIFQRELTRRLNMLRNYTLAWDRMLTLDEAVVYLNRIGAATPRGNPVTRGILKRWIKSRGFPTWRGPNKKGYTSILNLSAWLWSMKTYYKVRPYRCPKRAK